MIASLCGVKGESVEVIAPPSASRIRSLALEHAGFGLIEPDLPIGRLARPRDPVERAVLAIVTRGAPRALCFGRGASAKLAKVKDERALDFEVTLVDRWPTDDALVRAAIDALAAGARPGRELLREARERRGGASTKDAADLGRALVRAWNAGLIELR
jgi:hypothetical protein